MKLKYKSVLISGSSGLIGTALCEKFLANDYDVFGLDEKAHPTLKSPHFHHIPCDLSKETDIKKAVAKLKSLDVLINNAARTDLTFEKFSDITLKDWNDCLAVNLTSYFLLAKHAFKLLKYSKGSIINISSTRHLMSEPNTLMYSASKGAIVSLTHSLAITFGESVRVNCISPGWIAHLDEKLKPADHKQHPAGRVGQPNDVAEMALFLASEKAEFITGADFVVDGGMTKKMIYV